MSVISRMSLMGTAAEIRAAEGVLRSVVAQLVDANVWSGADADRFQREWEDLVTARLRSAAAKVEGCSLIDFSPF